MHEIPRWGVISYFMEEFIAPRVFPPVRSSYGLLLSFCLLGVFDI